METAIHVIATVAYGLIIIGIIIAMAQEMLVKRTGHDPKILGRIKRELRYPFFLAGFILLIICTWL